MLLPAAALRYGRGTEVARAAFWQILRQSNSTGALPAGASPLRNAAVTAPHYRSAVLHLVSRSPVTA